MPYHLDFDSFPDCMREFANYKRAIQGCSPKTVEEYMTDLRTFAKYLKLASLDVDPTSEALSSVSISDMTREFFASVKPSEITEFLSYSMDARGNSDATRSRKLSSIKAFYRYHVNKVHDMETNPASEIESPKKRKSLPKYLSLEESILLLNAVGSDKDNPNRRRDYCILTLFLNCGMRLSELCGISMNDIADDFASMRVIGKGNKERLIYLNDACAAAIKDYLPDRMTILERGAPEKKALFLSRLGKRISPKTVQWIVKKYIDTAGLSLKGYSTHKLRHTAATLMYQTGKVDIRVLKDILGHEQLTTTQIYTHVNDKSMKEAMSNNPLSDILPHG